MPKTFPDTRASARAPTPIADLNAVLAVFLGGVRDRLGETFVGAYLQGSFAVGDADANSDCDFIVAVRRDLTADEIGALNALHVSIHDLPIEPWRHRLEGSYAPVDILRRRADQPRDPPGEPPRPPDWQDPGLGGKAPAAYPFVYLDHGARTLVRSEHDNTDVVRWSLREKGIVLAGPDPRRLVDPVSADALRAEVRANMAVCVALGLQPMELVAWQAFWVILFCRMLHTLATGQVASKAAGAAWAAAHLDPRWRDLIERSQGERTRGQAHRLSAADPSDVAATRAFALWAVAYADHAEESRRIIARLLVEKRGGAPKATVGGSPDGRSAGRGVRPAPFTPPTVRPGGRGRRG
jgi:hypothetical protein